MSLFMGLNTALKGMMAQQTALDTTAHNIANANTEGYSRQRVTMEASQPISGITAAGQLGTGVDVAEVTRVRNEFLDYQFRSETSGLENQAIIADTLQQIETIFMEPTDTGLSQEIADFWDNWQELANNPESSPVRTALKESAVTLTDSIRQIYGQLDQIMEDVDTQIEMKVDRINNLAESIAELNDQIVQVRLAGENPNDLLDKRDQALDELSALGNITVSKVLDAEADPTGAVAVKIGDFRLVEVDGAKAMNSADVGSYNISDGSLAGLMQLRGEEGGSTTVQYYMDQLDTLAVGIAKAVNDLHNSGTDLDGNPGGDFFVFQGTDGNYIDLSSVDWDDPAASGLKAGNIHVNEEIELDVSKIAAAESEGTLLPGNGAVALQIADLRDAYLQYDSDTGVLSNEEGGETTFAMFYQGMTTALGSASKKAQTNVNNQQALIDLTSSNRDSVMGVSIDEEAANMVLYQHAFDASAKVISIIDEMLDTIINGLKV